MSLVYVFPDPTTSVDVPAQQGPHGPSVDVRLKDEPSLTLDSTTGRPTHITVSLKQMQAAALRDRLTAVLAGVIPAALANAEGKR